MPSSRGYECMFCSRGSYGSLVAIVAEISKGRKCFRRSGYMKDKRRSWRLGLVGLVTVVARVNRVEGFCRLWWTVFSLCGADDVRRKGFSWLQDSRCIDRAWDKLHIHSKLCEPTRLGRWLRLDATSGW